MDGISLISILVASFVIFQLLFHFVSSWFSEKISSSFNNLSLEKKIEWNSRVVSTCHSFVVGVFSLYIYLFDEVTKADPLWGNSSLVKVNLTISVGYLISDLLLIFYYWRVIGDKMFVIHHCLALYSYSLILRFGVLEYIGNFRLLAELSSPFVNQRWFFETLKYPKFSKVNVINGILMTVAFFIVRIAVIPPFYYFMYSVYGTEAYNRTGIIIQSAWFITCIVLDIMNIYWMIKITKGCIKVISLIRQEKARRLQNGKVD